MTEEELREYRKRVLDYLTSREHFEGLFPDGEISKKEFDKINNKLQKKYIYRKEHLLN